MWITRPWPAKFWTCSKRNSLNALVTEDAKLARQIFLMDEKVNKLRDAAYKSVVDEIQRHPEHAASLINIYLISRHLERVE